MSSRPHTPPVGGAFSRRFTTYEGLYFDEFDSTSVWLRERGSVQLPPLPQVKHAVLRGELKEHPGARGLERAKLPRLGVTVNGGRTYHAEMHGYGEWTLPVPLPHEDIARLDLQLEHVWLTNVLAWLGRVTGLGFLQRFRAQNRNRQLRLRQILTDQGEVIFDFAQRASPYSAEFARRHTRIGMNIVGFLQAELGVGESARCMVRAAEAAAIPVALVPLKLHCKNRLGDQTYATRLTEENPHAVNVFHIDPPAARDIDHHHGKGFRAGKYNIGYFAWELPDFPDGWMSSFDYFDEIWCPSDFTTNAIALKSPVPVITMPHAIAFAAPVGSRAQLRAKFNLPEREFLFLTLFDLNSYAARKNPRGAIEAFRQSGLAGKGATLVVKVQNVAGNEKDFAALQAGVADLQRTILLTETLSRADIYALEAACDCFVSLHRSEGYGLAVAEAMYLSKPVISTDWSATAEFVNRDNGCPVRAEIVTLEENFGPYMKGSRWAEPDPAHAADSMRRLFADPALAARLGAAAAITIRQRFSPDAIGRRYLDRLRSIASF